MNIEELTHIAKLGPPHRRELFLAEYTIFKKDVTVGVVLAAFLGLFGAQRFYLGKTREGWLIVAFCWTIIIPLIIAIVDMLTMTSQVHEYNEQVAYSISLHISRMGHD